MKLPHAIHQLWSAAARRRFDTSRSEGGAQATAVQSLRPADVLVAIVMLGIVGTLVGPQFSPAAQDPRRMALAQDLENLRRQIALYRFQHRGRAPQVERFVKQLAGFTDEKGNVGVHRSERFRYGPYLTEMPINALTGFRTVRGPGEDRAAGWVYDSATGELTPDGL